MQNINVTRSQDCAGYKWTIQWFYGGNKDEIKIAAKSLSGNKPSISVKTVVDGGVEFNPIPGDMLRTVSSNSQVSVIVNGIPSKCSTTCDFKYSSSQTPTVTSITSSKFMLINPSKSSY